MGEVAFVEAPQSRLTVGFALIKRRQLGAIRLSSSVLRPETAAITAAALLTALRDGVAAQELMESCLLKVVPVYYQLFDCRAQPSESKVSATPIWQHGVLSRLRIMPFPVGAFAASRNFVAPELC